MDERAERVAYWQWKSRECRVAARYLTDPADRLALLKLALIYRGFAERSSLSWTEGPRYEPSIREEPAHSLAEAAD